MPSLYTCPHGHQWKPRAAEAADASAVEIECPVCGKPGRAAEANTTRDDLDQTLVRPLGAESLVQPPNRKTQEIVLPPSTDYEILGELGRGATGVVYKARHVKLNRFVALKVIGGNSLGGSDHAQRFQVETQAVAQLQHANIVQVYEVGEFQGRPYCALELVDHGSLAEEMVHRRFNEREAATLIETLARAVYCAHAQGIIHRDLKPANVLLAADGTPKLTDFGLAKRLDDDVTQTQTGAILGTPRYMAPEQADGNKSSIGPATDIWALGVIFYELLTGTPPFDGNTILDTLEKVRSADPTPPRRIQANVPRDLETICLKCLEKNPLRRYVNALDLAEDLERHLNGKPIKARPIGLGERSARWMKHRSGSLAVAGGLALAATLLGAAVFAYWQAHRPRSTASTMTAREHPFELKIPTGLEPVNIPSDNPMTQARVELGRQLFFDRRLSVTGTLSCADCHNPQHGWSDGRENAVGVNEQVGKRNTPTIINVAFQHLLFWDGRANSLETQSLGPILDPIEMGMPSKRALEEKLNGIKGYRDQFRRVFGSDVNADDVGHALAAFERTILSGDAPYDRYKAGDLQALSPAAARGMTLFFNKGHCSACHSGPNFSDGGFHNIGIGTNQKPFDVGRQKISRLRGDRGAFRTPTLREIARTAPYMHNGSLKTLEEVIDHYDIGGTANPQLDEEIFPLNLTADEKRALLTFLREGLSSDSYPLIQAPRLPE